MKILITEPIDHQAIQILSREFHVKQLLHPDRHELRNELKDCDAIILRSQTKLDRELIQQARNLKVIGRAGVGVDNIDLEAATEMGILVINTPEAPTVAAAEHTFALMLALSRKLYQAITSIKQGEWNRSKFLGWELHGKTLGIIGLGRIGTEVAKRALGFGMRVLAYDPYISEAPTGVELVGLDELLSKSDIISLHVPLTPETRHMISKEQLEKMKPGAMIVNTSRGGVIDEQALYEALISGRIAGAALDVFEQEPPGEIQRRLLELEQVIATPHLGASTHEAQRSAGISIAEQVAAALKGEHVRYAVNAFPMEESIRSYAVLCENLGCFGAQLVPGLEFVQTEYHGEIANRNLDLLDNCVLKGALSRYISGVNYINSRLLAKKRGVKLRRTVSWDAAGYTSLVSLRLGTQERSEKVSGTIFGEREPRLTAIGDYKMDAAFSKHMLVIYHIDKPRVIGPIGLVLGDHGINIAGMYVGRIQPGGMAVMVLNVDSPLNPQIISQIQEIDGVINIIPITL